MSPREWMREGQRPLEHASARSIRRRQRGASPLRHSKRTSTRSQPLPLAVLKRMAAGVK